jgi:hypothetical protein
VAVPPRPAEPAAYPAVHDMPAGRGASTLSDAERKLLKDDLIASRERAIQQGTNPDAPTSGAPGTAGNP